MNTIRKNLSREVEKGKRTQADMNSLLARSKPTLDLKEAAGDADLIVEVVIEVMDVKKKVYQELGPLALGDLVGLETLLRVIEGMHRELGDKYRPAPILTKHAGAGRYGRKVGKGVFRLHKEIALR